jgi:drug/metabolite transporter (DMT)-like permease
MKLASSPDQTVWNRLPGGAFLMLAMVTVGSTVVASRLIAAGLPPFTAAALRLALALPIFLALMYWSGARMHKPDRRDACLLALQALCGSVGYAVLLMAGLRTASAADAGVITGSLPAVVALVGWLLLRERIRSSQWVAIVLATVGVAVVQLGALHGTSNGAPSLKGGALVFAAVTCEALFLLLNKRLRVAIAPLPQSTLMCALGLAFTAVPALAEQAWRRPPDAVALLGVLYYALVPTVGGYLLWYAGVQRVDAGRAALYTAVLPLSALALASLVLGESISALQITGAACVLAAIVAGTLGARH